VRLYLQRAGLVLGVAAVAVLCLSSAWLAAAIGIATAVVVAIDSFIFARPAAKPNHPGDRINVDLRRRR
jgi:hypothetical protein